MYVLVQHTINDAPAMWSRAQENLPSLPPHLKLHHSMPTPDGTHAICVWEAESIATLRNYLDPMLGATARNEYFEVVNKEGVALPTAVQMA